MRRACDGARPDLAKMRVHLVSDEAGGEFEPLEWHSADHIRQIKIVRYHEILK